MSKTAQKKPRYEVGPGRELVRDGEPVAFVGALHGSIPCASLTQYQHVAPTEKTMSDAYETVSKEAHEIARDTAQGIAYEVIYAHERGETMTTDALQGLTHERVDSELTYTVTHWVCAWGLPDASDSSISDSAEGFEQTLAARAYENLSERVQGFKCMELARELCEAMEWEDTEEIATALAALRVELGQCARCGHTCPEDKVCDKCSGDNMQPGDKLCVTCDRADCASA